MSLPKGIKSSHVWLGVIFGAWALSIIIFISMLLHEVPEYENSLELIAIVAIAICGPVAFYVYWLRNRMRKAKLPNGELLMTLKEKESELAAVRRENLIGEIASDWVLWLSGLFCLGLIAFQCYLYLRFGEWITKSWTDLGWFVPQTTWVGAQSILNWIANLHAGPIVFVIGFAFSKLLGGDGSSTYLVEREIEDLKAKLDNSSNSD